MFKRLTSTFLAVVLAASCLFFIPNDVKAATQLQLGTNYARNNSDSMAVLEFTYTSAVSRYYVVEVDWISSPCWLKSDTNCNMVPILPATADPDDFTVFKIDAGETLTLEVYAAGNSNGSFKFSVLDDYYGFEYTTEYLQDVEYGKDFTFGLEPVCTKPYEVSYYWTAFDRNLEADWGIPGTGTSITGNTKDFFYPYDDTEHPEYSRYVPGYPNGSGYGYVDCSSFFFYGGTAAEMREHLYNVGRTMCCALTFNIDGNTYIKYADFLVYPQVPDNTAKILSRSLALNGYIMLNFYVHLPDEFVQDPGAYVTMNNQVMEIPEPINDRYLFSLGMAAPQQTDDVTIKLFSGDGTNYPLVDKDGNDCTSGYTFTIRDYVEIANQSLNPNTQKLLLSMLNHMTEYGKYAQVSFNYKADPAPVFDSTIANEVSNVTKDTISSYAPVINKVNTTEDISYRSLTLDLDTCTRLNIYFDLKNNKSINDYKFYVDGNQITSSTTGKVLLTQNGTRCCLTIDDIAAAYLGNAHSFAVKDASNNTIVDGSVSPLSYAYNVLSSSSTTTNVMNLKNTMRSMYLYYLAADAYFG